MIKHPQINAFLQRVSSKALWVQCLVLLPIILCILLVLWIVSIATALGIGFRDGCVGGSSGCAIATTHLVEQFLIPATFLLLLASVGMILQRRIVGYKLFAVCIVITLLQALAPENYFFPLLERLIPHFF